MKGITQNRLARLLVILALFVPAMLPQNTAARQEIQDAPSAYIEPAVLEQIKRQGQADYWVILTGQADLSGAYQIKD